MANNANATDIETALATLRQNLQSIPTVDLASVLNHVRSEQTDKVLDAFHDAWHNIEKLASEHRALTGFGVPAPFSVEDVFESSPVQGYSAGRSHPDAWYTHEITNIIQLAGKGGASEDFISDFIAARSGDARHAIKNIIPTLRETGFITQRQDGSWRLSNYRSDAWYDYTVYSFINGADTESLPTTAQINEHVISLGGHGAEAVSKVLPRLESAGRISEVADGVWDVNNRKSDAWYDFTITAFIAAHKTDNLPTVKTINEHVIEQGGHGAHAVSESLPRLAEAGHIVEVEEGTWDITRRRPDAWYDHAVLALFYAQEEHIALSTKEIHDHVIELGGQGSEVPTRCMPRLVQAGKISDHGDGSWSLANYKPRAWYDHVVMSTIRSASPEALPSLKQIYDKVIDLGGHGAEVATTVLPGLVDAGEIVEVDTGVYDVAVRKSDAWYDQTVLRFIESNDSSATTMEIYEHVMSQGAHGAEVAANVLPRLAYAGLVHEIDDGLWQIGTSVPPAFIAQQVLSTIREHSPNSASLEECCGAFDSDLADAEAVARAINELEASELIECVDGDGDKAWRLPGTKPRKAASAPAKRRRGIKQTA